MADVIETDHLTKRYGSRRGIEDISLQVRRGEVYGFLGPNGAGKTTTIRTLLDLLHPSSGRARIFGLDAHHDARAIHARLGNLPGDFSCDPHLSGRKFLAFCAQVRGIDATGAVDALAERFGAELDQRVAELSRGNRQKIGLIQALMHEPELLVLDEPTTGLDPLMQEAFLRVLDEYRRAGRTVFLSSHDLSEVERICDRVAIVRAGRLAAVERVSDLREHSVHRVSLVLAGAPTSAEVADFAALAGVGELQVQDRRIRFTLAGELDPLLALLARHGVADLEVSRPSLEEIFLTFYTDTPGLREPEPGPGCEDAPAGTEVPA